MTKSLSTMDSKSTTRVKPNVAYTRPFNITNLDDGENIHQACLLVHGECQVFDSAEETNFVSVSSAGMLQQAQTVQNWPLHNGEWRALAMLTPGSNTLLFKLHHAGGVLESLEIKINYVPLLQLPPLHLAILVAKDSPLLIDCPPAKYGGISTAHSSIDAAVSKLRLSAYMWQALTAEDFRQKGLGRRSFRLEEEWSPNSTMQTTYQVAPTDHSRMGNIAKVHIIRSDKTVAEIRDEQCAQQNVHGQNRDALHQYFETALLNSGPPFESRCRPVVAGLILDSHYSAQRSMILGHAALGCHKPNGLSLGVFGSHLTYSWPRFMEEVPACLTDMNSTGDTVGNDNGECDTMRGACFVGQGAFLHEVGHAFGADHTSGIMARGYSKAWGLNFVAHETNSMGENDAKWDLQDVLRFKLLPHFALPGDEPLSNGLKNAGVKISIGIDREGEMDEEEDDDDDDDELSSDYLVMKFSCAAGLAVVKAQSGGNAPKFYNFMDDPLTNPRTTFFINVASENFDRSQPLEITALGMNGTQRVVKNIWTLVNEVSYIRIPGSNVVLGKQSGKCNDSDEGECIQWAMLLRHRGEDGRLYRATSIDLRVGCIMDGAVISYADRRNEHCGPVRDRHTGKKHSFGGHQSECRKLPFNESITKVQLYRTRGGGWGALTGIRMTLSNGDEWGALNNPDHSDSEDDKDEEDSDDSIVTLEPNGDEVIVGFYGKSGEPSGFTREFGILTAPRGVELPETVYDLPEFRNIA
jgi:Putative peptidase family